jgi:hypothetical protein
MKNIPALMVCSSFFYQKRQTLTELAEQKSRICKFLNHKNGIRCLKSHVWIHKKVYVLPKRLQWSKFIQDIHQSCEKRALVFVNSYLHQANKEKVP